MSAITVTSQPVESACVPGSEAGPLVVAGVVSSVAGRSEGREGAGDGWVDG